MKFYKCETCGNIIELIHASGVTPVCCGKPMTELKAGVTDAAQEKHVPAAEMKDGKLLVQVGSVLHPMTAEHYIMFIAVQAGDHVYRKNLTPEDAPTAEFDLGGYKGTVEIFEYCNLHGLWKAEINV